MKLECPMQREDSTLKIQQWIVQNAAVIPIYCETEILFTKPGVHGVELSAQAYPTFYDAWIEQ